jgi:hypothetical protein
VEGAPLIGRFEMKGAAEAATTAPKKAPGLRGRAKYFRGYERQGGRTRGHWQVAETWWRLAMCKEGWRT